MDGAPNDSRLLLTCAMVAAAVLVGCCGTVTAQPPALQLNQPAKPIPIRQAGGDEAILVRPRPRVIDANRSPLVAVLPADTDSSPLATDPKSLQPEDRRAGQANVQDAGETGPQGSRPKTVAEALDRKGSVTFRKTPLSEVVFLLSDLWQVNIVAGENVSGEVNGSFHNAPLREVLAAALTATGYSYRQTGSSLVVLPIDQIGADDPNFVTEMIRLPASLDDADNTVEAAQLLLSERGNLRRVGSGSLLVVDTADRVDRIRELFGALSPRSSSAASSAAPATPATDTPSTTANVTDIPGRSAAVVQNGIAYFTPQFTEAEEMSEPLREALGETVVVAVYPEENRIMVKGPTQQLQLARQAIEQLDVPRQQVRITAMIYDVSLAEIERLGVNFSRDLRALANAQNEALGDVTSNVSEFYTFATDLTTTGAASTGFRTVSDRLEASVFLEALDTTSEAKLLADPSITVADRSQASIKIVRKIPIVGANPVENSNAVFTQTEFEEAGVILNVVPRISRDGTIELKVQPEYSVVAEITSTGPVIDSRTADTTVRVADGQMFVLGGLRQKSVVESIRGVPYLKDMKYVGKLFRSHDTEVRESELIVFLKPELVTPYYPGKLREQRASCVAQHQLDAIPHAENRPQTPCCKDPYCPHHHPRPRINGGSAALEMMGGFGPEQWLPHGTVTVIEDKVAQPAGENPGEEVIIDDSDHPSFPPVHVDASFTKSN